jgi:hypothetical protein
MVPASSAAARGCRTYNSQPSAQLERSQRQCIHLLVHESVDDPRTVPRVEPVLSEPVSGPRLDEEVDLTIEGMKGRLQLLDT